MAAIPLYSTMLHAKTAANRRIGIALICLTTLLFSVLDATGKWLVQSLPVFQVVFMRFGVHAVLFSLVLLPQMREARWGNPRLQLLRGLMLGTMTLFNFAALQYLQLAETGAIQFSVPILIALFSAWWLGEHLDARRWAAVALGFVGVLCIIRPGSQAFHPAIFFSVLNAILYASFNIMTRHMAGSEDSRVTQLISAWIACLMVAPLAIPVWTAPESSFEWGLFVVMGLCGGMGHWVMAKAHRYASAAVLGPYLYQQILYMIAWGWLLFGQVPDSAVVLGACIVVGSGLYLLWREFRHAEVDEA